MKDFPVHTKNAINAAHEIRNTVHEMGDIIYSLKTLGIPAGEKLEGIANFLSILASECSDHIMIEQDEYLKEQQAQTWGLVGMVLEDAVNKMTIAEGE